MKQNGVLAILYCIGELDTWGICARYLKVPMVSITCRAKLGWLSYHQGKPYSWRGQQRKRTLLESKPGTTEGNSMSKRRWLWMVFLLWWGSVHASPLYSLITGESFRTQSAVYSVSFIIIYLLCGTLLSCWLIRSRETIYVVLGTLSMFFYFVSLLCPYSLFLTRRFSTFWLQLAWQRTH